MWVWEESYSATYHVLEKFLPYSQYGFRESKETAGKILPIEVYRTEY